MASNDKSVDENIEDETKLIFECYVETSFVQDKQNNVINPGTPGLPKSELPPIDNEKCWSIGKMLVKISDNLKMDEDDQMLKQVLNMINVNNGSKAAFRDFSEVAERVLSSQISWDSIAYLFRFGYLIARDRLVQGARDFLQQLCQWITNIFKKFSVFRWIIGQGGWSSLNAQMPTISYNNTYVIGGIAALLATIGILFFKFK